MHSFFVRRLLQVVLVSYITSRDFLGLVLLTGVIILHARLFSLCNACNVSVLLALCPLSADSAGKEMKLLSIS